MSLNEKIAFVYRAFDAYSKRQCYLSDIARNLHSPYEAVRQLALHLDYVRGSRKSVVSESQFSSDIVVRNIVAGLSL